MTLKLFNVYFYTDQCFFYSHKLFYFGDHSLFMAGGWAGKNEGGGGNFGRLCSVILSII